MVNRIAAVRAKNSLSAQSDSVGRNNTRVIPQTIVVFNNKNHTAIDIILCANNAQNTVEYLILQTDQLSDSTYLSVI